MNSILFLTLALSIVSNSFAATYQVNPWNLNTHPATITLNLGDTITWTTTDGLPHNVVWNGSPAPYPSSPFFSSSSYSLTFTIAGSFSYYCSIHGSGSMSGSVVVTNPCGNGIVDAGEQCDSSAHCSSTCQCNAGFADCNGSNSDGCESDFTLPETCGSCSNNCRAASNVHDAACNAGKCTITSCNSGFGDCNAIASDGCESAFTSAATCGSCSNDCLTKPNVGSATCTSGKCHVTSCSNGYTDCNGFGFDGCEINTAKNANNCGACGVVCDLPNVNNNVCKLSLCTVGTCDAGYGNCDTKPANGCEAPLNTSTFNCGACGNKCAFPNAVNVCTNGVCGFNKCVKGFCDANGVQSDGCEVSCP